MSKIHVSAALLLFFSVIVARGQDAPPKESCEFDGDASTYTLEERVGLHPTTLYQVCKEGTVCGTYPMEAGHPIEVYKTEGAWACGYYTSPKMGGGPVWVKSAQIRPVPFRQDPKPGNWVGVWRGATNKVTIGPSKLAGTLKLKGNAYWQGLGDNVHFGDFSGEAAPHANRLHFAHDGCVVDMALFGPYIVASDNMGCGGMNVRFQGIWRRTSRLHEASRKTS